MAIKSFNIWFLGVHNELDVPHQKTTHRELSLQPGGERLSDETSGGGGGRGCPSKTLWCSRLGLDSNKYWLFLKIAASSAIMDLTDDYLISANVNMSSLKFVIDRLSEWLKTFKKASMQTLKHLFHKFLSQSDSCHLASAKKKTHALFDQQEN